MRCANGSITKAPLKAVTDDGTKASAMPAITIRMTASRVTRREAPAPANTPIIKSASAPTPSRTSGRTGKSDIPVMPASLWRDRGELAGGRQCRLIIRHEMVDGGRRDVHHRARIEAEEYGEHDQRREDRYLAAREIEHRLQRRLVEHAQHDATIE